MLHKEAMILCICVTRFTDASFFSLTLKWSNHQQPPLTSNTGTRCANQRSPIILLLFNNSIPFVVDLGNYDPITWLGNTMKRVWSRDREVYSLLSGYKGFSNSRLLFYTHPSCLYHTVHIHNEGMVIIKLKVGLKNKLFITS